MSITRLQQARQMYAMGQRVAKTLDSSRPGYRGDDAARSSEGTSGGRADPGGGGRGDGPASTGGDGVNQFTDFTKDTLNPNVDFVGNTTFGPTQKYTGKSSFFGGANKYGYTNQYVDPTKSNFGNLKPGYFGRAIGGLGSLITGIPFVGSALGKAYDYGKGIFAPKTIDMSQYNNLGLYDDRMKQKAFYDDALYSDNYSDMKLPGTGGITDVVNVNEEYTDEELEGIKGQESFLPALLVETLAAMKAGTSKKKIGEIMLKNQIKKQIQKNMYKDPRSVIG